MKHKRLGTNNDHDDAHISPERQLVAGLLHHAVADLSNPSAAIRARAIAFWQDRRAVAFWAGLIGLDAERLMAMVDDDVERSIASLPADRRRIS